MKRSIVAAAVLLTGFSTVCPAQVPSFQWLGNLPDAAEEASPRAVSGDGSTVVGDVYPAGHTHNDPVAGRWTAETGWVSLGTLPGHNSSGATAASADGSVVAGVSMPDEGIGAARAFRWTEADGFEDLGILSGDISSHARDVSADGLTVVGDSYSSREHAFAWTPSGDMPGLGFLNPNVTPSYSRGECSTGETTA